MKRKTIAVLFGGCSTEYEISLQSASAVLEHMDKERFAPLAVGITREGRWLYYTGPIGQIAAGRWQEDAGRCTPCAFSPDRGRQELLVFSGLVQRLPVDAVFPVLHGKNGEDGTVQGLLELAGFPLVGCGTLASALGMDKDRAHRLAAAAGVAVPRSAVFRRGALPADIQEAALEIGYPLFVKPVRSGSSFGVSRVPHQGRLARAVEEAFRHDGEILLEEEISGFEVGCAVMGNDALTAGAVDEIELSGGFFNFEEKYTLKTSKIHCPARISPEKAAEIQETAKAVYRALGCRVFARVDLFLTPEGRVVFNEVNTIPGFTAHSRFPSMMREAGVPFGELVSRLIDLGVEA